MRQRLPLVLILSAMALYACSLFQPAFVCAFGSPQGYAVLAIGWAGLIAMDPRWFANLGFLVLLWRTLGDGRRVAPIAVILTGALAIAALAPAAGCPGAGGAPGVSTGLAFGGYLWQAAMLLACIGNLFVKQRAESTEEFQVKIESDANLTAGSIASALRDHQLRGSTSATCPICGSQLEVSELLNDSTSDPITLLVRCKCGRSNGKFKLPLSTG